MFPVLAWFILHAQRDDFNVKPYQTLFKEVTRKNNLFIEAVFNDDLIGDMVFIDESGKFDELSLERLVLDQEAKKSTAKPRHKYLNFHFVSFWNDIR